ncbi:LON peptidase substrate-binding domain-containing protein [Oleiagrimonas sp. C23AA]|uniref:LON peptidase substrate-binding domain-containing protein n=1 Tax=Oleiagrimonas sp. C23AA TaxID=2719047 RepID=UPI00141FF102|nr:LON peptidase substrate-binding domain-containing protein [Oleiagrimonas sp. C23AA]NII12276.1 peptidase S16 [Oleiagrimonas sp. C23AA]
MASRTSLLNDIPLFPLSGVLFPEAPLQLRIFESRYLDMLRECSRTGQGFGVCLILDGREVGEPATPAAVGTLARVTDFYTLPDGLLGITALGSERFRVVHTRVRSNGLVRGDVQCWLPEPVMPVPPEFGLLVTILQRMAELMDERDLEAEPERFDDASWVGFRLAELLPLDVAERQQMLELTDPLARLAELRDILPRFQKG